MEQLSKSKIKLIQSLRLKKYRDRESKFIVEGSKSIREFMNEKPELLEFIVTVDSKIGDAIHYGCDERTFKQISSLSKSDGTLAVFSKSEITTRTTGITLILDGIQDPGNFGTIIRTADWFGIESIICSNDTVDMYNEKVVQSTMGSLFRLRVEYTELENYLNNYKHPIYGALMEGENLTDVTFKNPCAIIMGNEGNGIRPNVLNFIDHPIHIQGKGKAESLNVAIATGIILSHFSD